MEYVVINLDRSKNRLDSIINQFEGKSPFTRFSAISNADHIKDPLVNNERFEYLYGDKISKGQLGCFLSHIECLKKFIESGSEIIVILEDDVLIDDNAFSTIKEVVEKSKTFEFEWQCINLSSTTNKRFSEIGQINGHVIRRSWEFPLLTSALIWNKKGAAMFLESIYKNGIYAPADDQLRDFMCMTGNGISLSPPVVKLEDFESDITIENIKSRESSEMSKGRPRRNSLNGLARRWPKYKWSILNLLMYNIGLRK